MSPIAAKLEAICETWLVDLLDLPKGSAAGFVSGTSTASLCGLLAGRNAILSRQGWDVGIIGIIGIIGIRRPGGAPVASASGSPSAFP